MIFIPASKQLVQAIKSNDANKVEEIILNSDSKRELILDYVSVNDKESLITLLPQFKSKGLVSNIQNLLNI